MVAYEPVISDFSFKVTESHTEVLKATRKLSELTSTHKRIARGTAQKGLVLEKNALNRLVHNLLELISKGYNPTDLSQQPSCNFPGKQIKILFHNLYVD